jgi:hypothetical protein
METSRMLPRRSAVWFAFAATIAVASPTWADSLRLELEGSKSREVQAGLLKPFDVIMVAERDSGNAQLSAVAYTLELPEGAILAGEELFVDTLLGLGSSRAGMNLVFRCVDNPVQRVMRLRVVPTKPMTKATLALRPDTRTNFLGLVTCKDENFSRIECKPDSLLVTAR